MVSLTFSLLALVVSGIAVTVLVFSHTQVLEEARRAANEATSGLKAEVQADRDETRSLRDHAEEIFDRTRKERRATAAAASRAANATAFQGEETQPVNPLGGDWTRDDYRAYEEGGGQPIPGVEAALGI